jgi:hypothetical protein
MNIPAAIDDGDAQVQTHDRSGGEEAGLTRVEAIRELERMADDLTGEAERARYEAVQMDRTADSMRWDAAHLIAEELKETGKSQRQLAREIDKSHTHVRKMALVWRLHGNQVSTGAVPAESFNKMYRKVLSAEDGKRPAVRKLRKKEHVLADPVARTNVRAGVRIIHNLDEVIEWLAVTPEGDADVDVVLRALRSRHQIVGRLLAGDLEEDDPMWQTWLASLDAVRPRPSWQGPTDIPIVRRVTEAGAA